MVILNLVNLIWNTGNFPKNWKIVIIIPIFKPDKYSLEPNKYIPITLTSCLGKLFEMMVNLGYTWWMELKCLLFK